MTASLWAKICGLSTAEGVSAAVLGGADAVGFVLAPGSPRTIEPSVAARLRELVPETVETVAVFRAQPPEVVIDAARRAGVDSVQLHGDETPDVFDAVRGAGFRVIRATSASRYAREGASARRPYGDSRLLLDAPDPGEGETFDASILPSEVRPAEWILAGGLSPTNVRLLVDRLRPTGVDVSSGVERSRGVKDPSLIRAFLAEVHASAPAP